MSIQEAKVALKEHLKYYPNVLGVGIGGYNTLNVYVIHANVHLPSNFKGYFLNKIITGNIEAQ